MTSPPEEDNQGEDEPGRRSPTENDDQGEHEPGQRSQNQVDDTTSSGEVVDQASPESNTDVPPTDEEEFAYVS